MGFGKLMHLYVLPVWWLVNSVFFTSLGHYVHFPCLVQTSGLSGVMALSSLGMIFYDWLKYLSHLAVS